MYVYHKQGGKTIWKSLIKYQYTTKILAVLMSARAVLSTSMKTEFCSIYSHISYLTAGGRAGRKEDELLEMKNKQKAA